jgi:hypothetical protein
MKSKELLERVGGESLKHLADMIFSMAEENAYDNAAEERRGVSGDDIFKEAKAILNSMEDAVSDRLKSM